MAWNLKGTRETSERDAKAIKEVETLMFEVFKQQTANAGRRIFRG